MSTNGQPNRLEYEHEVKEDHNLHELHAPIMREKQEPRDGFEPVPPFFAPLFGGLIFWAGFFFALKFYDFKPAVLSEEPPEGYTHIPGPLQPGTTYFWQVVGRTFASEGDPGVVSFSELLTFTTSGGPGGSSTPSWPSSSRVR